MIRFNLRFLLTNLVVSGLVMIEFIVALLFLEESQKSYRSTKTHDQSSLEWIPEPPGAPTDDLEPQETDALLVNKSQENSRTCCGTFNFVTSDLILIIATSGIAHFSSSAYNKLLIDFLSSPLPVGRNLSAKEIGYVWSGTALVSMAFQGIAFSRIAKRFGYARFYSITLILLAISWVYTPFIGINGSHLWSGLAIGLTFRKIVDIANFTCYLLLVFLFRSVLSPVTGGRPICTCSGEIERIECWDRYVYSSIWSVPGRNIMERIT